MPRKFMFVSALMFSATLTGMAQQTPASYEDATKVFRLDGGNVTYAFGVNPRGEL